MYFYTAKVEPKKKSDKSPLPYIQVILNILILQRITDSCIKQKNGTIFSPTMHSANKKEQKYKYINMEKYRRPAMFNYRYCYYFDSHSQTIEQNRKIIKCRKI